MATMLLSRRFFALSAVLALTTACSAAPESSAQGAMDGALPEGHPPLAQPAPTGAAGGPAGVVLETMNAAGYTYARVESEGEEIWVAGPLTELAEGDEISLGGAMGMTDFHSASLDRTFESILFVNSFATARPAEAQYRGTVLEAISAAGYTYLRVDRDGTELWLAGPVSRVAEGQVVAWNDGAVMRDFESPSLGRTFDELLFVDNVFVE